MKLYSLHIQGFRRIINTTVYFGDATFLIGQNNHSKSSILKAIEILLSGEKTISENDFYMEYDEEASKNKYIMDNVILTAEFRNISEATANMRGFKGRVFHYDNEGSEESGLKIIYRKTFQKGQDVIVEMQSFKKEIKDDFVECKNLEDFINKGIEVEAIKEIFKTEDFSTKITARNKDFLDLLDEIWDIDENEINWFKNPGGIMGNVLSKLPSFLLIPANDNSEEIDKASGTLHKTLGELFKDVRATSENYKRAQEYLDLLTKELNPNDADSEFGKMMLELNSILGSVFPGSRFFAKADLSNPDDVLKLKFDIEMSSNITTKITHQGTGMIRSAVFALLRFRRIWEHRKQNETAEFMRKVIIGFEEPELYLHPNAINKMRDTIYEIADSGSTQIVCSTHSPYMIDLSRKEKQILNNCFLKSFLMGETESLGIVAKPFNITDEFKKLQADEKSYVKMLLKIDDQIARVFFVKKAIIVEGDTEDIVFKETISRMPAAVRNKVLSDVQIIKARGKASIISLVKYLKAMGINVFVIHDRDNETPRAAQFNQPILEALGNDESKRVMLEECIEDVLGYGAPEHEKPYTAYNFVSNWRGNWESVPSDWRSIVETALVEYFD